MSQTELAQKLTDRTGRNVSVSFCEFSQIENDCADLSQEQWQVLIAALAAIFQADLAWFQKINDCTPLKTLDASQAIFLVYLEDP